MVLSKHLGLLFIICILVERYLCSMRVNSGKTVEIKAGFFSFTHPHDTRKVSFVMTSVAFPLQVDNI